MIDGMRRTGRAAWLAFVLIAFGAALFALSWVNSGSAVETSGTVQTCVSKYTGVVIVRDVCGANEDWLLIEGVYNPPAPPTRPAN